VLNKRTGVRGPTVQRVMRAAAELEYLPDSGEASGPAAHAVPAEAPMRLSFLLPAGQNRFIRMLGDMVNYGRDNWTPFNVRCRTEFIESFNPHELAAALRRHAQRADGIALMALEHPAVREAMNEVVAAGVPVVTLISDLSNSPRAAYLGLDNRAAGRTAGYLIGRFIGLRNARVAGFQHVMAEMFGHLQVLGLREGHDDSEQNHAQTRALLEQHPDLGGIYNIGGASDGVARALKETGRDHKVVLVGHGLTPDTRALLIDGSMDAVITQSPQTTLMNCVRIFTNLREKREALLGVEATRSQVIFRENLP